MDKPIVIGSRKSDLAVWQAREVQRLLKESPGASSRQVDIQTELSYGDRVLDVPLTALATSQPGCFTKELETGLFANVYDIAVHSLKDMPTTLPDGLVLAGITVREDPRDALVVSSSHSAAGIRTLMDLPRNATIGTSSLRRQAALKRLRPDIRTAVVRGNLNTRIQKLDGTHQSASPNATPSSSTPSERAQNWEGSGASSSDSFDALLLASAGLLRMGWGSRISEYMSPREMAYGVGQGALGIEVRSGDLEAIRLAHSVTHPLSALRCLAERHFLNALQGGCQVPIGVETSFVEADLSAPGADEWTDEADLPPVPRMATLRLRGIVSSLDGGAVVEGMHQKEVTVPGGFWKAIANAHGSINLPGTDAPAPEETRSRGQRVFLGCTAEEWNTMNSEARVLGRGLAEVLLEEGARSILGPLLAHRPITYGSAEQPLDR